MRSARLVIAMESPEAQLRLRSALQSLGYPVVGEAGDAESAWHLARRLQPDLVLLQASAVESAGFEAAEAIRSATDALVLLVSNAYDPAVLDRAREVGTAGLLVEPITEGSLDIALCMALDRRAERQALRRELEVLKEKLEARKLINRAKAILMERHGLSEPEAFRRLQTQSMTTATPMKALAEAVILSSQVLDGDRKPHRSAA
jgi:AmiR/NasT family two-component response regulator